MITVTIDTAAGQANSNFAWTPKAAGWISLGDDALGVLKSNVPTSTADPIGTPTITTTFDPALDFFIFRIVPYAAPGQSGTLKGAISGVAQFESYPTIVGVDDDGNDQIEYLWRQAPTNEPVKISFAVPSVVIAGVTYYTPSFTYVDVAKFNAPTGLDLYAQTPEPAPLALAAIGLAALAVARFRRGRR